MSPHLPLPAPNANDPQREAKFFSLSLDIFCVVDMQGAIQRINGASRRVLGFEPEEMEGRTVYEFVLDEDHNSVRYQLGQASCGAETINFECRCRHRDGTHRWLSCSCPPPMAGEETVFVVCRDITEGKQAESRFRALIEAVPTGILLVHAEGQIVFANSQSERLFGYEPGELLGLEIEALVPKRLREEHRENREAYQARPLPRRVGSGLSLSGRRKDGSEFPADVALSPIELFGKPLVVCTVLDLSERLSAQKNLAVSERRLRDILDNTPAIVYVKDLQGRYILVNDQFEQLFNVARKAIKGKSDYDIFPKELADIFRTNDLDVARTGEILTVEEQAPHDDGIHTYVSVKFPLRDNEGQIYAVAGISTDITDRVRANHEAMHVKYQMELILNSIGDGILGLDHEGKATFVNPAAEDMLGWTAEEIVGQFHAARLQRARSDGTKIEDHENDFHNAIASGKKHHCDNGMLYRNNGTAFHVELRTTPVEEDGKLIGSVLTFRDLTERAKRLQAEHEMQAARRVQEKLYPKGPPEIPGFDIAGYTFPASQACGDYYDFITLSNGNLALVIGDVAGHGLGPALQMVQTRAYLRAMLMGGMPPVEAIEKLNLLLIEDTPQEAFITLFMAVLDPLQRGFVYLGAGHEARLIRANNKVEKLTSTGIVLGIVERADIAPAGPHRLHSGDILLITTDGILESVSPTRDLFGWRRTLAVVRENRDQPAKTIIDRLHSATQSFSAGKEHADDVTLIVAKVL